MSRIVIVILIYHRHKPIGVLFVTDSKVFEKRAASGYSDGGGSRFLRNIGVIY
jgi:hypothetical protein